MRHMEQVKKLLHKVVHADATIWREDKVEDVDRMKVKETMLKTERGRGKVKDRDEIKVKEAWLKIE